MATEFNDADSGLMNALRRVVQDCHPLLEECGAAIGVTVARNDSGPAVKHHGVPAFATIKVVSTKDRTKKRIDAEILIDGGEWDQMSPAQQVALLDHELSHLKRVDHKEKQLRRLRAENPDAPEWKLDCHGRPKLKTVVADFTPGDAFEAVIARHGYAAVEFIGAKRFHEFAEAAMAEHESQVA